MADVYRPQQMHAVLGFRRPAEFEAVWQPYAPRRCQAALPPIDLGPLRTPPRTSTPSQHQALRVQAVTVAQWLVTDLRSHLPVIERRRSVLRWRSASLALRRLARSFTPI